ncbi:MAG TPA: MBL fold metallo-hydrolase [Gaiellaceae bacterium]|nr:MBL fold metallo-hydrolase [Gaiellaceae bacterium]
MPDRLRWLGHSTVLLELEAVRVLTDPLLRRRILHLRRAVPLVDEPLDRLDAVLVSHLHYDHLDPPSLRRLDPGVTVVVPTGAGKVARRSGLTDVQEVTVGETVRVGGVAVRAVRAEHGSSRVFGAKSEALGYLVEGAGRRVYFPGDTDLYPEMAELAPGLDVALLPIWGWGPSLGPGHLDPRRAAEALALLRPQVVVPIHWGTYYPAQSTRLRLPAFLREPVWAFERHAAELAPEVEVRVLEVGGELPLAQG